MRPTPFDRDQDFPPIPFDRRHCDAAARLRDAGLVWKPHVGCFVWDRDNQIEVPSPFPLKIYFILNLGHFLRRFETVENMVNHLVWLPTWHQSLLLCRSEGIDPWEALRTPLGNLSTVGDELLIVYELLVDRLANKKC